MAMKTNIGSHLNIIFSNTMAYLIKPRKMSRLDRKYFVIRQVSRLLLVTVTLQLFLPRQSKALTTGPSQPEVMQFQQAGTSGMVDPFTGAFNYNIPLFELPGPNGSYPFNLAYQSGVTMDQEASWVGLGWSLNPGAITRTMRGLPDEFDGDLVHIDQDMKADWTVGVGGYYGAEFFGADSKIASGWDAGLTLYYNNYRGFGYTFGIGADIGSNNDMSVGGGLNLSLDSQDGVDISPKLTFGRRGERTNTNYVLGMGYNSRRGLTDIAMTSTASQKYIKYYDTATKDHGCSVQKTSNAIGGSSTLYSASSGSVPYIDREMAGFSVAYTMKTGPTPVLDPYYGITGRYSTSFLSWKEKDVASYGFLNLHKASEADMVDMNRENEGVIRKETPNLAIPILTNDVYSISGQGTGGAFRAWRNDVGVGGNRKMTSVYGSGSLGTEFNPFKGAFDFSLGATITTSGVWENGNEVLRDNGSKNRYYGFHGADGYREDFEPWYFKIEGDLGTDPLGDLAYAGGDKPVRIAVKVDPDGTGRKFGHAYDGLEDEQGNALTGVPPRESYLSDQQRRPRNQIVSHLKLAELNTSQSGFGEYSIHHYSVGSGSFTPGHTPPTVALDRQHPGHHFAGMTVSQADGMRYVYALPAYNKQQVECQFSVDGSTHACDPRIDLPLEGGAIKYKGIPTSDEYYNKTTIPEYVHSHLLTSVLGADYVDADDVPGPSDGDLGYWVKFNYVKVNDFKWRAPFVGANLDKGQRSALSDDKGSYMYGEREEWYLASAETKTHIAEFSISPRFDNRGALKELQNANSLNSETQGAKSYKLDQIALFSKLDLVQNPNASPLTKIRLTYVYELCKDLPNNENYAGTGALAPNSGKLALKKVEFLNEDSNRGANNPYEFEYSSTNPGYDFLAQDKWGNYRPNDNNCITAAYPYTKQYQQRSVLDAQNSAWHLVGIDLPTGGKLQIDYEANDYAYVQDKPAMEMYRIMGTLNVPGQSTFEGRVYTENYRCTPGNSCTPNPSQQQQRTIYIDLGRPVFRQSQIDSIIGENKSVYFKCLMNLKRDQDNIKEYVHTYLDRASYGPYPDAQALVNGTSIIYITLEPSDWNDGKLQEYHPLAVAAWTHLRSNLPQMMALPAFANPADPGTSQFARRQMAMSLLSAGSDITSMFSGFYDKADNKEWATHFDPDSSFVRLNNLEMKKVGGGCRVKKITLSDEWTQAGTGGELETGVVYDYTMTENGRRISAGVASYEPMVGGDENPLRYAKRYPQSTPMMTDYNLFQTMPLNESYMPAPSIGYRQVTVKSLNTDKVNNDPLLATIPSTGAVVHEFWTAKDFPVSSMETEPSIKPFRINIPVPFIGFFGFNDLTASQGYSIVLNDMHGKPKRVSNYGVDQLGKIDPAPINWVEYKYAMETQFAGTSKERNVLSNVVNSILFDVDPNDNSQSLVEQRILGQDHEYFVDMREFDANSFSGGLATNADFAIATWIPSFWPNATYSKSRVRTAVTNKIIHRSGILTGTLAYNQGSLVETKNLLFDAQTGRPLLTRVTNDYNAPIYSYEYPAFWAYDGMGPAYKNSGLEFRTVLGVTSMGNNLFTAMGGWNQTMMHEVMIPGDELVVIPNSGTPSKAYFVRFDGNDAIFYSEGNIAGTDVAFRVIRSGRRNLLNATAEQIVSLRNPTIHRGNQMCWRDIANPLAVIETTWVETNIVLQYVPDACWADMIYELNHFFSDPASDPNSGLQYSLATPPIFGCYNCPGSTLSTPSTTQVTFDCMTGCAISFVDATTGQPLPIASIDHIANLHMVAPMVGPPPFPGAAYSIHVDAYVTGSNTPVDAYLTGCPELLKDKSTSYETEVNTYHSTLLNPNQPPTTLETEMFMLDSVLSATAQTFSDAWMQDYADVRFATGNAGQQLQRLEDLHPFANGQRGVWRPKDSYVYVTDRRQSTDINTAKDGTFSGMPMFDFQSITFDHCAPNWRKTNEVTRYSPYGNELENRDVLNVYSTALYGYNGKLPIAVSANADYREVGFESFEEYANGASVDLFGLSTGNLDFPTLLTGTPRNVWTYTDIKYGSLENFYIDGSVPNSRLIHPIATAAIARKVQGRTHGEVFNPSVFYAEGLLGDLNGLIHFEANDPPYLHQFNNPPLQYAGRLVYERPTLTVANAAVPTAVSYSDTKAHTGELSLKLKGVGDYAQNRLKLSEGESYTVQLWVSRANTDVPTYYDASIANAADRLSFAIGFFDAGGTLVGGTGFLEPTGELVEGWQKIEANFTVPVDAENIGIRINSGKVNGAAEFAYFDDIRIQPLKSKMTCYVYDPRNYKLRATLDDDNFALVYRYDEAGNLYLVQKETVEGMRTVQESRGFMIEN